jgi:hypothetical protein
MFFLILLLSIGSIQCDVQDGWKDLRPLVTSRPEAEKKIGSFRTGAANKDYYDYETEDAFVQINYSTVPCSEDRLSRGQYSVPTNTILDYWVVPKKKIKLTQLRFDRTKFERVTGHVLNAAHYENTNDGIDISVTVEIDGTETLAKIRYTPPRSLARKYSCEK